jgi:hypothetical protein
MKFRFAGIALSSLLVLLAPNRVAQSQSTRELTDLAGNWLSATGKGDREALDRLIDEDFIGASFGGKILTKADILPEGGGESQPSRFSLLESASRILGNTGIVVGRVAVEGPQSPGPFRFMVVFLRKDQGWKLIAANLARVEK